jgi:diaminohydroxyphosphoribosylaminopyrimidine deaminase / 5-amino-6-(5-phosphoribosylamino)uracil reductase
MTLESLDLKFMEDALAQARLGAGRTHPNPAVGAVIVKDGRVVGRGSHAGPGRPHAEILALREAGQSARGADLYVTLEPCCHHGRTPPCADAIVKAGVRRVIAAVKDPNPIVSGKGIEKLLAAGVQVVSGVLGDVAAEVDEAYHLFYLKRRPMVTLKWAQSLDGRVVAPEGGYLTGEEARRRVHEARYLADAVLVSGGTALRDDPRLTVRLDARSKTLVRIITDADGRVCPGPRLLSTCPGGGPIWVLRGEKAPGPPLVEHEGVERVLLPGGGAEGLGVADVLRCLRERSIMSVYVEAVGRLASAFLSGGWVDRLEIHLAPMILGGSSPGPAAAGGRVAVSGSGLDLSAASWRQVGRDRILYCRLEGKCLRA